MVALAALAILGSAQPAEPWFNSLMGVGRAEAIAQLKEDKDSSYLVTKDDALSVDLLGDPTALVWTMNAVDEGDKFSLADLITKLGYDASQVKTVDWKRGEMDTKLVRSFPGLKSGWQAFAGEYDLLFVGPQLAADFDQMGRGVSRSMADALRDFGRNPTWSGAVDAYGPAQHIEMMDDNFYTLTWKSTGRISEVQIDVAFPDDEAGEGLRSIRTEKNGIYQLGFTFKPGLRDWKQALRLVGLDPSNATWEQSSEEEEVYEFKNVKGAPEGWLVFAQYNDDDVYFVGIGNPLEEEPGR